MKNMTDELLFECNDGIGIITLNRPERRNALTSTMGQRLVEVMEEARRSDNIKVLIITGSGEGFCAGADAASRLNARISKDGYTALEKSRSELLEPGMVAMPRAFMDLGKPVIAAINGVAAAAGLSLTLLCDFRIASQKARFAASWVRIGLIPDVGASFWLPKIVGIDNALKLFYTGEIIDAAEARRINLVTQVVPHDELMSSATDLAGKIARGPSVAIELAHRTVYRSYNEDLIRQLLYENHAMNICFNTDDFREGTKAFLEKRKPEYKGI